jgi:hypothetical protein
MLMSYLRSVLKISFFSKQIHLSNTVLLTKPVSIYYERYCVSFYLQILEFLRANLEKHSTLEDDVQTLK